MTPDKLTELRIAADQKRRPSRALWMIFLAVALITGAAVYYGWPRNEEERRIMGGAKAPEVKAGSSTTQGGSNSNSAAAQKNPGQRDDVVLTVTGYLVNRERIELSPRFMGVVKWIGVTKGDTVTNGQVVVLLDDAEYKARLLEIDGRLAGARAMAEKAELEYRRTEKLATANIESKQLEDNARLTWEAAKAAIQEIEGQKTLMQTYLDWTVIRSPINGVVLEKLVDPNELVVPQSFGGTRGPSTALIALADPKDLQVEIDLNEADVAKVGLKQPCRVSPEAWPDKVYEGYVAEMAPEANRQKGTLQIKVQIRSPDLYLTPELTAKVDFLKSAAAGTEAASSAAASSARPSAKAAK